MTEIILYTCIAFVAGFVLAWVIRTISFLKLQKLQKSTSGFLESERLKKETLRNENVLAHQHKQATEIDLTKKLKKAYSIIKQMDEDILLMQKANEETEALLQAGQPELHNLKLKLLEAQNTIARSKKA